MKKPVLSGEIKKPVVIVGMGQLGCTFAEGFLRSGHPVIPVRRQDALEQALASSENLGAPPLLVVATGEDDLAPVLSQIPAELGASAVLLQNELRPSTWAGTPLTDPTVVVVWFEKKPGKPLTEVRPSVVFGPFAELVAGALRTLGIRVEPLPPKDGPAERAHQLILKNLYILGLNLAGLDAPGTAEQVLKQHTRLLRGITGEVLVLERKLLENSDFSLPTGSGAPLLDEGRLERELDAAILSDPGHGASGRSAPRRLSRTLALARGLGLQLEVLEALASRHL